MNNKTIPFGEKLQFYLKSCYPFLWVKTHEETRVVKEIIDAFAKTKTPVNIYCWDSKNELRQYQRNNDDQLWKKVTGADTKIMSIVDTCANKLGGTENERSIVIFKDFHPYIEAAGAIRSLREAVELLKSKGNMFIFVSPIIKIPVELERDIQILDFHLPNEQQLGIILESVTNIIKKNNPDLAISPEVRQSAIEAARGLTTSEANDAFSLAIVENQKFNQDFIGTVFDEKVKQVKRHGLLQYLKPDVTFDNIGGLEGLKRWIKTRAKAYTEEAKKYGLRNPRGILLSGIPGVGKSLVAKATANELGFPLFQLDIGGLFSHLVGDSEANFRKVIETVDGIGRCVLFIDLFWSM